MKDAKEIWIKNVMNSHKGRVDLTPRESLFDNIKIQIAKVKPISVRQMALAGVAASVLILINTFAIHSVNLQVASGASDIAYESELPIISEYNLYDYE
ncbi:MAG: hypothetical protein ACI86M_000897 [Saprospiraceae bacterium]|jgi:hypothetical protein